MKVRSIFATLLALLATMIATPAFASTGSVGGSITTPTGVTFDSSISQTSWRVGIDGLIELALPGIDTSRSIYWAVNVDSNAFTSDSAQNAWFGDCSTPNDGTTCLWIETTPLGDLTVAPVTVSGSLSYTDGAVTGTIATPTGVTFDASASRTTWYSPMSQIELALPGINTTKSVNWSITVNSTTFRSDSIDVSGGFSDCSPPNNSVTCLVIDITALGNLGGTTATVSGSIEYQSTFDFSDVIADFAAIGLTVDQNDLVNSAQYNDETGKTTYYLTISNNTNASISYIVDELKVDGVTVTESTNTVTLAAGELNQWYSIGSESGNKYWGYDNAVVSVTIDQLVASTATTTGLTKPSGITVSAHQPAWDYIADENKTCITLKLANTTSTGISVNTKNLVYSVSGTNQSPTTTNYYYVPARSSVYVWYEACLPGDLRYDTSINVGGTLTQITGPKLVNKIKLPSGYTATLTVNDVYYNTVTRKSYVGVNFKASGNVTNTALRFENLKLNGKKISGEIVSAAYESEAGQYYFSLGFDPIAGDQRLGKTFTLEGKVTKETKTRVIDSLVISGLANDTGVNMMGVDRASSYVYDAKKNVTEISMDASNWSTTTKTFNFSAVVVKVKVKDKKGKWTSVKSYKSLVGRVSVPRQDGKTIVVAKIPGDLRSNWQPITLDGSITSS